jgi:hypothetical protein
MSNELKDILSNLNKDIEQEKLLQYLNRRLSEEEQHLLEQQMNDDEFVSDAMEGLEQIKGTDKVNLAVSQLNAGLKKQLENTKKKRRKTNVIQESWIYYAVILLLLLAVVGYVVIRRVVS